MVLNYNRNLRLFSPLDLKKMILGQCSTPMTISYGNLLIGQEATVSGSSFIWTQIKILDVIDSYNIWYATVWLIMEINQYEFT